MTAKLHSDPVRVSNKFKKHPLYQNSIPNSNILCLGDQKARERLTPELYCVMVSRHRLREDERSLRLRRMDMLEINFLKEISLSFVIQLQAHLVQGFKLGGWEDIRHDFELAFTFLEAIAKFSIY